MMTSIKSGYQNCESDIICAQEGSADEVALNNKMRAVTVSEGCSE